ncbi:MarR family transcriptional regulator (plasmid) [Pseudomonas sp. App30]|uniref:MarR family transcriptional regulator n=1 Tax=Pseudomonas sp. App30 TaxID=3068990 RepID=UPI003A8015AA
MTISHLNAYLLVTKARVTLEKWMTAQLKSAALTITQFRLLELLAKHGGTSPVQCSMRLGISSSAVTLVLDQLESRQLLTRARVPSDRRSLRVQLTQEGTNVHAQARAALQSSQMEAEERLPTTYFTSLNALLECLELLPGDRLSVVHKRHR